MFGMEDVEDTYCVIIGREIPGGCEEEICYGLDHCPYFKEDQCWSNKTDLY